MTDAPNYTRHQISTDALDTLGTIIGPFEQRDAVHLAVFPVQAGEAKLRPGDNVYIGSDGKAYYAETSALGFGIVDPFIETKRIGEGEWFWLMVYPRQITSLHHVWEHPRFPGSEGVTKEASERWLRDFCDSADCPEFEIVVAAVTTGYTSPDGEERGFIDTTWDANGYVHFDGIDAHSHIPAAFWRHMENYTGQRFAKHPESFSCSC